MTVTKAILTSIHGKLLGIAHDGKMVVDNGKGGRSVITMDDTGAEMRILGDPATINATATMLAADLLKTLITSTSAAAVTATLPTGTLLDAAAVIGVNESFVWRLINTGPSTVTVAAGTGHTLVGTVTVLTLAAKTFVSRKTAANTFVTYCL
jgi:hypothetical protein